MKKVFVRMAIPFVLLGHAFKSLFIVLKKKNLARKTRKNLEEFEVNK